MFLAHAGPKGRALIDRELCLPRSWTGDEDRLAAAKVLEETAFRTKPQLLRLMIERALAMLALAWLAVTRASLADDNDDLMTSANEICRIFTALCSPPPDEQHARRRPRWHHRHQERARWPVSRFPVIIEA